jgi:hypothetical protein
VNQSEEVFDFTLISNCDAPEILQPCVQSFDFPASFEPPQLASILRLRLYAVSAVRCNHFNALLPQFLVQRIAVVSSIPNQSLRFRWDKSRCDSLFHKGDFMRRSTFQVNGDRKTRTVCHCHDLCTFAPLGLSDFPSPFLADTNVPSIKHSLKSNFPRSLKSSASAVRIFSSTPSLCHSWKRRWQVAGEGNRSGKSCQAAPVRSTQRMPFKTSRFSFRGRPLPSSRGSLTGISGSRTSHCSSVSCIGLARFLSLTYSTHF